MHRLHLDVNNNETIERKWAKYNCATVPKFVDQWFPIFLVRLSVILDTLFVATIKAFVTAWVAMISRSAEPYICILSPVPYLTFLSKVIEKVVAVLLTDYLFNNDLNESLQFADKKHHNCETALLRVQNDILKSIDNKLCVVFLLLDLSAAFDTVNHKIWLHRLRSRFVVNKF